MSSIRTTVFGRRANNCYSLANERTCRLVSIIFSSKERDLDEFKLIPPFGKHIPKHALLRYAPFLQFRFTVKVFPEATEAVTMSCSRFKRTLDVLESYVIQGPIYHYTGIGGLTAKSANFFSILSQMCLNFACVCTTVWRSCCKKNCPKRMRIANVMIF